jgi:hypothetical protein
VAESAGVVLTAVVDDEHVARLQHRQRLVGRDVVVRVVEDRERDAEDLDVFEDRPDLRHHHAVAPHRIGDGGGPDPGELLDEGLRGPLEGVVDVAVHGALRSGGATQVSSRPL